MLRRLDDKDTRKKIVEDMESDTNEWENLAKSSGGWQNIIISYCRSHKKWQGKSVARIAQAMKKTPYDAIFDILVKEKAKAAMIILPVALLIASKKLLFSSRSEGV